MISSLSSDTTHLMATEAYSTIVPLQQRLVTAPISRGTLSEGLATVEDVDEDPLARAFLEALRELASSTDPNATAIGQLIRKFVDPATDQLAFVKLEEQVAILQYVLCKIGPDDPLSQPVQATLMGTANIQLEITKWMQDICMSDGTPKEFEEW
ncbi:hypothetical protein BUE93_08485 [Chromobacterium amazonense]|uniref:Uncharacterized protein n=1 Tax=Chromobacterium amazonense TaxID=1382803 RepID=A0A2S9X602_9NEIS|nr:hypothetical protein [Chromobacterium amazonense]PRP71105.1 hypothetical protein BUE93_08485 [Chromobacterium amazonense]